jgi:heme-degrading monooxygenase HmoA
MFVVLWQFQVKRGLEKEFEKVYGPEGSWTRLFRPSPAFHGTRLLRDTSVPGLYFTMDFWDSQTEYGDFRKKHATEYSEIDNSCKSLTERESHVASFEKPDPPLAPD